MLTETEQKIMKTISTKSLKLADVPDPGRSISKIDEFALTYNWDENGDKILPYTIDSEFEALTVSILRYILYSEQRRWNHFGRDYDTHTEARIRLLISVIRQKMQDC